MTTAVKHRTFAHPIPSGKEWKRRAQNFPLVHMAGSPTVTRPKHINIGLASKKQQVRKEKNDDESRVPRTKNLAMGARLSAATHHKPPPAQEGHSFFFFFLSPATCRYPGFFLFAAAVDPPFSSIQLARVARGATGKDGGWI